MLHWAIIFFALALVAAIFGFGGIATASAGIAQLLFVMFAVVFVALLAIRVTRRR